MGALSKGVSKALSKNKKKKDPKKLTKAEKEKLKNKLKREAKAKEREREAEVKKKSDRRPLQKNIKFKKKYDTDIGKENPFDRQVKTKSQDTVRKTGKRTGTGLGADSPVGPDPIVVGRQSMPTMRDINRMNEAEVAKIKNKVEKLAKTDPKMKKLSDQIDKLEAQKFSDMNRKSAITRAGKKPDQEGTYLNKVTGEYVTIKGSKGISAKERFLPLDYPGAKKSDFIRNPTKAEEAQVERSIRIKRRLEKSGDTPEKDLKRAKERAKTEKLKKVVKTTQDPKYKRLDIDKKSKGGMGMKKKKGYAKGGMMKKKGMARGGAMMKKKGMAMGGLKKPAANQTGLKKLPTSVRNKMGYAKNGGMMKKKGMAKGGMKKKGYAMGGMTVKYKVGGMAKGKSYGMVDNRKKK